MIGSIERYIYCWNIGDRLRNYMLHENLNVMSFSNLTACQQNVSIENMIDFYEKNLDVLFNHKIDNDVKSLISHEIYKFYINTDADKNALHTIEYYLKAMDAKKCALPNWRAISTFFMSNGFFYLALIARGKYKERLFSTKGRVYRWARTQAYLEDGDITQAQKEIQKIDNGVGMRNAYTIGIPTAKRYIQILTESKQKIKDNRDIQTEDKKFYDFLNGKKIVIEGPAPENENLDLNGDMIYVRNNDFHNRNEKKTDITYLNYQAFESYKKQYKRYHNKYKWKFICYKQTDANFRLPVHTRIAKNPTGIFLMGHPHMLPLMIYDLAGEDIYVTGNNLFITSTIHNKEYKKEIEEGKVQNRDIQFCRDLGEHDVISQYIFLKRCYDAKLFDADRQLAYVLSLGVKKYCEIMDKVHGVARENSQFGRIK